MNARSRSSRRGVSTSIKVGAKRWLGRWWVDIERGLIEVYREPGPEGYRQRHTIRQGERLSPAAFPQFSLTVDEVLG